MSDSVLYRPLGGDFEIRSGGGAEGDGRTIEARFVPYNVPTRIDAHLTEEFLPGAFRRQVRDPRIPLALGHLPQGGTVIGKVVSLREEPDGLYGTARISNTTDGNNALELLRDGVFDSVSIGFRALQDSRGPNGIVQRRSAEVTELAIVLRPAYTGAKVLALREEDQACPHCGHGAVEAVRSEPYELVKLRPMPLPPVPRGA